MTDEFVAQSEYALGPVRRRFDDFGPAQIGEIEFDVEGRVAENGGNCRRRGRELVLDAEVH